MSEKNFLNNNSEYNLDNTDEKNLLSELFAQNITSPIIFIDNEEINYDGLTKLPFEVSGDENFSEDFHNKLSLINSAKVLTDLDLINRQYIISRNCTDFIINSAKEIILGTLSCKNEAPDEVVQRINFYKFLNIELDKARENVYKILLSFFVANKEYSFNTTKMAKNEINETRGYCDIISSQIYQVIISSISFGMDNAINEFIYSTNDNNAYYSKMAKKANIEFDNCDYKLDGYNDKVYLSIICKNFFRDVIIDSFLVINKMILDCISKSLFTGYIVVSDYIDFKF